MSDDERSSRGGDTVGGAQRYGPEVLFSRGGARPPCLDDDAEWTPAVVASFLAKYDSYVAATRREAGDGFERRPAELSELVGLAHQDNLAVAFYDYAVDLTDEQIREGLETVAGIRQSGDEIDIPRLRSDLKKELAMSDKPVRQRTD